MADLVHLARKRQQAKNNNSRSVHPERFLNLPNRCGWLSTTLQSTRGKTDGSVGKSGVQRHHRPQAVAPAQQQEWPL